MPDVRSLIETAQTKGLRLFLADGKVKVQAPQSLDGDTNALIEELRGHREEVKSILAEASVEKQVTLTGQLTNVFPFGARVIGEAWEDGKLQAEKLYSRLLEDELWVVSDDSFEPTDRLARYYADELPTLWNKTPKELLEIHKVKSVFLGCRLIQ